MSTTNYDRGRCLRYKSDLQKSSLPPTPVVTPAPPSVSVVETRHSSLLIWSFLSLFVLLLYIIYRRREEKPSEEQIDDQLKETNEEIIDHQYLSSENHSSTTRLLPTITEENVNNSMPSMEKRDSDDLDDFVRVPPVHFIQLTQAQVKKDSTEMSTLNDETGHPIIFRKFCAPHENAIPDDFRSLEEVNRAVQEVGLVRSQLIFGIDYTISNLETGKYSFNGLSLHHIAEGLLNPYQSVITIVGRTLEKFDSDTLIPAFGFGDRTTLDRKIFPLRPDGSYCRGFRGVLDAYNKITPKVRMSGPTNFAPLIKEAIRIVKKTGQYHILVIVADGQVTNERQTKEAIVEASYYPLSIVMIGVGDGPWDMMEEFDDSLPTRQFDNFQFVNYNSVLQASYDTDTDFALHALMEIPSQYAAIKKLGLLKET